MKKLFGLLMVLAMAGAFMTLSMEQSNGEPVAAMSHEIEIAGSGGCSWLQHQCAGGGSTEICTVIGDGNDCTDCGGTTREC